MTSLLEKTVAIIAPHRCIVCSNYNNIVCVSCVQALPKIERSICVLCGVYTANWRICQSCAQHSGLTCVYVRGLYENRLKELIHRFKFDHARDAHKPIAAAIAAMLPSLGNDWVCVPVPTVAAHVRQRSYDHAQLIAREVALLKNMQMVVALERSGNSRQVGATRAERAAVEQTIALRRPLEKKVLLIDDVCTTGATLNACASLLKRAGAVEVRAAVVAWQPPASEKAE